MNSVIMRRGEAVSAEVAAAFGEGALVLLAATTRDRGVGETLPASDAPGRLIHRIASHDGDCRLPAMPADRGDGKTALTVFRRSDYKSLPDGARVRLAAAPPSLILPKRSL
jgi:hypothetical protein